MLRIGPKRTISTSGGFGLLQMVSVPARMLGPQGGRIVRSPHWLERRKKHFFYKGVETSP